MHFFFQAEDGIRGLVRSRGLGDVYKRQAQIRGKRAAHHGFVFNREDGDPFVRRHGRMLLGVDALCLRTPRRPARRFLVEPLGGGAMFRLPVPALRAPVYLFGPVASERGRGWTRTALSEMPKVCRTKRCAFVSCRHFRCLSHFKRCAGGRPDAAPGRPAREQNPGARD